MRKGWNGITISRDTIHIEGLELGYKNPVLFERHAVGGEYGAGHAKVGPGTVKTTFTPADGSGEIVIDNRTCSTCQHLPARHSRPPECLSVRSVRFCPYCPGPGGRQGRQSLSTYAGTSCAQ